MNILSYRGPQTPGGVSATLSRVIERTLISQNWWYFHGASLRRKSLTTTEQHELFPASMVEGHYRYCNNFLWPILHQLPQYASFSQEDHKAYLELNKAASAILTKNTLGQLNAQFFINDYQFALCPKNLAQASEKAVDLFWHIPWPKAVDNRYCHYLKEIARGLLFSRKVGFHTQEYVDNFMQFIDCNFDDYVVDFASNTVSRPDGRTTRLLNQPLGLDTDFWMSKLEQESPICKLADLRCLEKRPFVLSVDRADYTKGVFERLEGIEHFLCANPEQIGKVLFVQVCQKTRPGLVAFDNYWVKCRDLADSINSRWGTNEWTPIVWIDNPLSSNTLAWLYARAAILLITAVKDGLNLTAKEFSLCSKDGVLVLSAETGAWQEFSQDVLTLLNLRPDSISKQIAYALSMPKSIRQERMIRLKDTVLSNDLDNWWNEFGCDFRSAAKVVSISAKLLSHQKELSKVQHQ